MMPLTISNVTGDGVSTTMVQSAIEVPDSGTTVLVTGQIINPTAGTFPLSGSPLTIPAVPGSGSVFYILQASLTTGVVTVKQSPTAMPTVDAGNTLLFSQSLVAGQADPALDQSTTPDTF